MGLLTYLGNEYTMIDPQDSEENRTNILEPFDIDRPLPGFIKSLQYIQHITEEGGQPISDSNMVMVFYNRMKETGMVNYV